MKNKNIPAFLYILGFSLLSAFLGINIYIFLGGKIDLALFLLLFVFLYGSVLSFSLIIKSSNCKNKFILKIALKVFTLTDFFVKIGPALIGTSVLLLAFVFILFFAAIVSRHPQIASSIQLILYLLLFICSIFISSDFFAHWLTKKLNRFEAF